MIGFLIVLGFNLLWWLLYGADYLQLLLFGTSTFRWLSFVLWAYNIFGIACLLLL